MERHCDDKIPEYSRLLFFPHSSCAVCIYACSGLYRTCEQSFHSASTKPSNGMLFVAVLGVSSVEKGLKNLFKTSMFYTWFEETGRFQRGRRKKHASYQVKTTDCLHVYLAVDIVLSGLNSSTCPPLGTHGIMVPAPLPTGAIYFFAKFRVTPSICFTKKPLFRPTVYRTA